MRTTAALLPLVAACAACAAGPPRAPAEPPLAEVLGELVARFDGRVGVYARRLGSGEELALRADETFPTASLVKVPILFALYARVESGARDPHETLVYEAARSRGGEDLLASFTDGAELTLSKLVHLMVAFSDNTASVWCQELAGGGAGVNDWLADHGFESTRCNSRTPGREEAWRRWGWGQTTPREMAELLVLVRDRGAVSPRADEELHRVLCRTYWDSEAVSALPPRVQAMSKQGALSRSRSEVVLVHAPGGDYVFCVITDGQADTSWGADNAGFVLLRDVSALLWSRWGDAPYAPPAGAEAWW